MLYRESLLTTKTENSSELVRNVLSKIKTSEIGLGLKTEDDVVSELKRLLNSMCENELSFQYDASDLLQSLRIILAGDVKSYESLDIALHEELTESGNKRSIISMRKRLTDFFKELDVAEILNTASYRFKFKRDEITDTKKFIGEIISSLEPLQVNTLAKDPAITGDIDLGDDESLHRLFRDIKEANKGNNIYKTGWKALDRMLHGGFRPGMNVIGALQHKYKTGFSLTLFKQLSLYNKPLTEDKTKKPLLLRISFEDDLELNLQFLYQSLKYDETREQVDVKNVDIAEMSNYVKNRLQVNGFHIKLLRVNPDQWTYMSICNKIVELEAEGYNVEVLMMDYLSKVPTTGCTNTGAIGTDVCDLFSRVRNFCSP